MSSAAVRVAVALSGGVDSAVAALFLKRCVPLWRDVEALMNSDCSLMFNEVQAAVEQRRPWSEVVGYTCSRKTSHDPMAVIHYLPVFMKNWEDTAEGDHGGRRWCEATQQDYNDANDVAHAIGLLHNGENLPLHNYSACYVEKCFEPMLSAYARGETLNVDVLCNEEVKFRALLNTLLAKGRAQYLATGHYARSVYIPVSSFYSPNLEAGRVIARPFSSRQDLNDQTVFLSRLSRMQVMRAIFPLGHVFEQKADVRTLAAQFGFVQVSRKKTSTGLCFVGEHYKRVKCEDDHGDSMSKGRIGGGFTFFLEEHIAPNGGFLQRLAVAGGKTTFVDAETGSLIEESKLRLPVVCFGSILPAYSLTIGQMIRGKGSDGRLTRYYVQRKELFPSQECEGVGGEDCARYLHTVWLVDRWDHPLLFETVAELRDVVLSIHPRLFGQPRGENEKEVRLRCRCCARHQEALRPATLFFAWSDLSGSDDGICVKRATVVFDEPVRALTRGQALVAYRPLTEEAVKDAAGWFVLASGWIV